MSCLWSGQPGFNCWIYFALVFSCVYFWVLIVDLSPFISLFVCIWRWCIDKFGIFHANQIYVSWSTLELRVRLVSLNMFKPPSNALLTVPRRCFFFGSFLLFMLHVVVAMLSFLFLAALWSLAGKGLTSWLSCVLCFLLFLPLSHMVSGSGVVPDLYLSLYFYIDGM